jgi:hypothetical protein
MAINIGSGITIGGGISLDAPGGGGGGDVFTVGGNTVSITTSYGAAPRIEIVTNGAQSALASWTTTADLTRSGGSATIAYDIEYNSPVDNGNGTWTYSFYIQESGTYVYPGDFSWDTMTLN